SASPTVTASTSSAPGRARAARPPPRALAPSEQLMASLPLRQTREPRTAHARCAALHRSPHRGCRGAPLPGGLGAVPRPHRGCRGCPPARGVWGVSPQPLPLYQPRHPELVQLQAVVLHQLPPHVGGQVAERPPDHFARV